MRFVDRRGRRALVPAVVALALTFLAAACGAEEAGRGAPSREADVEGEIRTVTPTDDGGVVVLIVPPGDACGVATAVERGDRVLAETADGLQDADVEAIGDARSARAWLDTPIAESCPGQASASDVVIVDGAP